MKKVLIFGKQGLISYRLNEALQNKTEKYQVFQFGSDTVDFLNQDSILNVLNKIHPNIIINASAYTAVDKAEQEIDLALRINSTAVGVIADWCGQNQCHLIHYSTDYVFDGQIDEKYCELKSTNPINYYGFTKMQAEELIKNKLKDYSIFRICWIYDVRGKNFYQTMKNLMSQREQIGVVKDQFGVPTWAKWVADFTVDSLDLKLKGVFHLVPEGESSWFDFANEIKTQHHFTCQIKGIETHEYPTPAKRPNYSVMNNKKIKSCISEDLKSKYFKDWKVIFQDSIK